MAGSELVQHLLEESQSYPLPNCSHINKWMFAGRGDLLPDEVLARLEPPEEADEYRLGGRVCEHQDPLLPLPPPRKIGDFGRSGWWYHSIESTLG